jgi:hypothetical protein
VKYSTKRGHVVPDTHAVAYGVLKLRRSTLLPELKVGFVFDTASIAVPVAPVAFVVDPKIDTLNEEFAIPTLRPPAIEEVAFVLVA